MTTKVSISPVKLTVLDDEGNDLVSSYGLRVQDDNGEISAFGMRKSQVVGRAPQDLIALARDIDEAADAMIQYAEEHLDGIEIGGKFVAWPEAVPEVPAP